MNRLQRKLQTSKNWVLANKTRLLQVTGGVLAALILVQLLYPSDRMLPFAHFGQQSVGGWHKNDAAWQAEQMLANQPVKIYIGDSEDVYAKVKPAEIGLATTVDKDLPASEYPWYMRLVPSSLLWYHLLQSDLVPDYSHNEKQASKFLERDLAASCVLPAKDASLKYNDESFDVVPARAGGTCKESDALQALASAKPTLENPALVRIPATVTQPKVSNETAQKLADSLVAESKDGIRLEVAGKAQTISQDDVLSWLVFTPKGSSLTFAIDAKKANGYLNENVVPKVSKTAGTTRISTRDFTVLSKQAGATGQTLATTATLDSIEKVLLGSTESAKAITAPLKPKVVYTRSYTSTSTGIAALITHYDEEHAGDFGVAYSELGGSGRSASHQSSRQFTTASTYKLFVAYGTLKNIDSGKWKWTMQVTGGRNLTTCFDDMIVKSDNACAEALLKKLGYSKLTNDIRALGLYSSGFTTGDTPLTTAGDLNLFLTKLQSGSIGLKSSSRDKLISAMKRNIYRAGVPSGASGTVANKVGFLNALLHDAAIVYSPKGTYALTIMSEGSTWANIAELTRKIEALR